VAEEIVDHYQLFSGYIFLRLPLAHGDYGYRQLEDTPKGQ
jgi:hypothetical protein